MDLWRFMDGTLDPGKALDGEYNLVLVGLSYAVAALAAFAALYIAAQAQDEGNTRARRLGWVGFGGLFMGSGIWAMHFIGMLAYSLPMTVTYDPVLTIISVIPGILGSAAALYVLSTSEPSHRSVVGGSLFLAAGIGVLHYTGMEAMRMEGVLRYDVTLFVGSVLVAFLLALIALYARFLIEPRSSGLGVKAISAAVIGAAVSGMHYTAMGASYFFPPESGLSDTMGAVTGPVAYDASLLAGAIGLVTVVLLSIPLLGAMMQAD